MNQPVQFRESSKYGVCDEGFQYSEDDNELQLDYCSINSQRPPQIFAEFCNMASRKVREWVLSDQNNDSWHIDEDRIAQKSAALVQAIKSYKAELKYREYLMASKRKMLEALRQRNQQKIFYAQEEYRNKIWRQQEEINNQYLQAEEEQFMIEQGIKTNQFMQEEQKEQSYLENYQYQAQLFGILHKQIRNKQKLDIVVYFNKQERLWKMDKSMECKRLKNRAVTKRLQRRIKYDVACKISNEKSEDVLDD